MRPSEFKPMLKPVKIRQKRCKVCCEYFTPRSSWQKACKVECAQVYAALEKAKKDRQERQKGLQALKTKRDWIRDAQIEFNRFCRFRDQLAGHSCISSGRPLNWTGNQTDAGHYRSIGSAPHLRFNEDNCHAQSKHDNQFKSGAAVDYRIGLIARIGLARVEALESDNTVKKWSIEELIAIRDHYRKKANELKKLIGERE